MIFSQWRKLVAQSFAFFENKKYTIKINFSLQIVELFTAHLVVYFFLNRVIFKATMIEELKCAVKKIRKKCCL
jgi:hypothetical protein